MRPAVVGLITAVGLIGTLFLTGPSLSRKAMARRCLANMKSVGSAAGQWASGHGGLTSTNWVNCSSELISPRLMLCPADPDRKPASDWTNFGPDNTSYEIVGGGIRWGQINRPFFRCKVHGFVCLADGFVTTQPVTQSSNQEPGGKAADSGRQ